MGDVRLTKDLNAQGIEPQRVASLCRQGRLRRVRRGAVASPGDVTDRTQRHRDLIEATWPQLHPGSAISHWSAAVLHGLWLHRPRFEQVWVTRDGRGGGKLRTVVHMVHCPVSERDLVEVDAITCTSRARTVVDIARHDGFVAGVVAADHTLRMGTPRRELQDVVAQARRRPGNATARRVVAFADGRSESAMESELRALMEQLGLPRATPQYEIFDANGEFVARVDLALEDLGLVIEFDGEEKYRAHDGAEMLLEVLAREKAREQAILAQGWWILRLRKADLRQPAVLAAKIRQAIAVAGRRHLPAA